jgi:hypothetical protein
LLSSLKIELPGTSPRVLFPPTPKWKNTNLLFSVRKACYFAFTKERSCFQTGIDKEKKHLAPPLLLLLKLNNTLPGTSKENTLKVILSTKA